MNKTVTSSIISLVALGAALGIFLVFNAQQQKDIKQSKVDIMSLQKDIAMMEKKEDMMHDKMMDADTMMTKMDMKDMPASEMTMEMMDVMENIEYAPLDSVDARLGTATASRTTNDGMFVHRVVAEVSDPLPGKFYEGWLVKKPSFPVEFFSTGKMVKDADGMYVLEYSRALDEKALFNEVVITEETLADGLDNKPEAHIFEGRFK